MENRAHILGNMNVKKLIIKMSIPSMLSMVVQALYNIVDSIFISRISEKALTALSLVFPVQFFLVAIFVGLGVGINSYMSRLLGKKDYNKVASCARHGYLLALVIWLLILALSIFLPVIFYSRFTSDPVVLRYSIVYTKIIMIFSFGNIFTEVGMNILRANGDMISSMKIQLLGAISNIILDPMLIFGLLAFPNLGVKGAALATVLSQIIAMIYSFYFLIKGKYVVLNIKHLKLDFSIIKEILKVSVPSSAMQFLGVIIITTINFILVGFSGTAIALLGVYIKIESLIYMPIFGLSQGIMPIIGYNYGANNKKRVKDTMKYSIIGGGVLMSIGFLLFQLFPRFLLMVFNASDTMISMGVSCFRIISPSFILFSTLLMISTYFQGIGKAKISLLISFFRQIIFLIPFAFVFSKIWGVNGVWLAFPVTEVATLLLYFTVYNIKSIKK